ncbi:MAG: hypothetical protein ACREQA_02125 [Candidatus Binatia bacterium]
MSDQIRLKEMAETEVSSAKEVQAVEVSAVPQGQKKGWLKGMLPMAICCGAPLLLLLAIPLLGSIFGSLAAVASGLLGIAAVLACPLGMYFMMRMMMNNKK